MPEVGNLAQPAKEPTTDRPKIDAFMDHFVELASGATTIGLLAVADRSGLNRYMSDGEARTVDEIAAGSGLDGRYVREILSGLSAAGVYDYDPNSECFSLAPEHALFVADESSPYFMGGWFDMIPALYQQIDALADAARSGGGVGFDRFGAGMIQGIARGNEPSQRILLASRWLPGVPGLVERLESGIQVADVGCGSGGAALTMARAFPQSDFVGFDVAESAMEAASAEAKGIANLHFEKCPLEEIPTDPGFDLITSFDVIHDLADPLAGMRQIRRALKPGGVFLMMEPAASSNLEDNLTPRGALLYGVSAMHCMTQSLAIGGQGVGTVWGRQVIEKTARDAGFDSVERLEKVSNKFSDFFALS